MSLSINWCYLATVLAVACLLYFIVIIRFQDKLVFPRPSKNFLLYDRLSKYSIKIQTEAGCLQAWKFNGSDKGSDMAVLLFCGNGDDAANFQFLANSLPVKWVYAFNYRGYGCSEGEPSEAALFSDALLMYEKVEADYPDFKIGVLGFSLGTTIAGYVAVHKRVDFLVLVAPICSLAKLARSRFYIPFAKLFIKNNFDLLCLSSQISTGTLLLYAENDLVVPLSHSLQVYHSIQSQSLAIKIKNAGHNNMLCNADCQREIVKFICQRNDMPVPSSLK